jgi:hypothetical protein
MGYFLDANAKMAQHIRNRCESKTKLFDYGKREIASAKSRVHVSKSGEAMKKQSDAIEDLLEYCDRRTQLTKGIEPMMSGILLRQ